ncbi:phosphoribosylglycinamide formyltransferase [Croceivirga thetidis]|uniref:Phosphoribosylglycinamide formyltransferase n=1 Tax=Croceivirga thetidis TaxID=2721623 RepID=A0ABX1GNB3_9FLAO|nr:phosphoribosylglycinamide formyltransferase [Croceivirga thetidis]NKI31374.1 phosphoribosylglycinamide formyltransferase [Croceivirga thetidis]
MSKIVIFASGSGSNAENIHHYFKKIDNIEIACILTNKEDAGVIERCKRLKIPLFYFNQAAYSDGSVLKLLQTIDPTLIVLAGFLRKIPVEFISAFPSQIVNIHPALLPKYGGKGMYGMNVHNAVKLNGDSSTGITIHYVNGEYDEGAIIHQAQVDLNGTETPEEIAQKVHGLEYEHFPRVIEKILLENG